MRETKLKTLKLLDTRSLAGLLFCVSFWLGVVFLHSYDTFSSNPAYGGLSNIITENRLGWICLSTGFLGLISLKAKNPICRATSLMVIMILFTLMGVSFVLYNPFTTGSIYIILALGASLSFINTVREI